MAKFKDLTGMRFGRLIVVRRADNDRFGHPRYVCQCDTPCGVSSVVSGSNLRSGVTRSCGCIAKERASLRMSLRLTTHGLSRTRAYRAWGNMMARCYNETHPKYKDCGGAGRKVCERWRDKEKFCEDMGDCPPGMQLDREKNELGYWCGKCAECLANGWVFNCRWVTRIQNMRNRSDNHLLTAHGKTMTISEWAELTGINYNTIHARVMKHGWSHEDAVTIKPGEKRASKI